MSIDVPPPEDLPSENPLQSDDPAAWAELLRSLNEASLLVLIRRRLGSRLAARYQPEDVLQDVLARIWRSRQTLEWQGLPRFRALLVKAIENRIRDLADHEGAEKRGGDRRTDPFSSIDGVADSEDGRPIDVPAFTSTPGRSAVLAETADAIEAALDEVSEDCRAVVQGKIIEGRAVEEIGREIGLGVSGVRHRLRRGLEEYRHALRKHLTSRSLRMLEG